MHIRSSIAFVVGAAILLFIGLSSLVRDLMQRGPHEAPDEGEVASPERQFVKVAPRQPRKAVTWNGRPEQQRL